MAQAQLDYILQSFSLNIDGYGMAGSGEKCTLPKIKKHMEKFRGGGMVAPRQHALGRGDRFGQDGQRILHRRGIESRRLQSRDHLGPA